MRRWSPARSAAEATALEKYHKAGVKQIANVKLPQGGVYAVSFRPDGKILAAGGADGLVRLFNPETGSLVKEFAPVTVRAAAVAQIAPVTAVAAQARGSRRDRGAARGGDAWRRWRCYPGRSG